jgi:uncharacterized protein YndB with AHSA1/START domain
MNTPDKLEIKVELTVLKKLEDVFKAVLDPRPFFVQKASGKLEEQATIHWRFEEFPMEIPIQTQKIIPNQLIRFQWGGEPDTLNTVEFQFKILDGNQNATTVSVIERGWSPTEAGRAASCRNTGGWMHMLCSLKAFLEHGINLRTGSFSHMKGIV